RPVPPFVVPFRRSNDGLGSQRVEHRVDGADGDRQRVGLDHQPPDHAVLDERGIALGTGAQPERPTVQFQPRGRCELAVAVPEHDDLIARPDRVTPSVEYNTSLTATQATVSTPFAR